MIMKGIFFFLMKDILKGHGDWENVGEYMTVVSWQWRPEEKPAMQSLGRTCGQEEP